MASPRILPPLEQGASDLVSIIARLQAGPRIMDSLPAEPPVRPGFGLQGAQVQPSDLLDKLRQPENWKFGSMPQVLRPQNWQAISDEGKKVLESIKRPGHVYRGMEKAEYEATVGAGKGIRSSGAYSHKSEGTNFASDPADAESYVNFGRSDPRKTGQDTFIVEAAQAPDMTVGRDGYIKAQSEVLPTRVWRVRASDGALVLESIK